MKKKLTMLLLSGIYSTVSNAQLAEQDGFELTLSINTGVSTGQSQFDTSDDNAITQDLTNNGQQNDSFLAFPLARLQYTFNEGQSQLFLGNSEDQITEAQLQMEIGFNYQLNDGSVLTLAYFPNLPFFNETWKDPYLVNKKRETTDQSSQGGRIAWSNIAASPFTLRYAFVDNKIDDEQSGKTQLTNQQDLDKMHRDSQYHRITLEGSYPLSQTLILQPLVHYTRSNAEGEAFRYDNYNAQLGVVKVYEKHTFVASINAGLTRYKETNPIFDKQQENHSLGLFSIYSYQQPFDWTNTQIHVMAGFNQQNSNINFYDSDGAFISTGLAYTF